MKKMLCFILAAAMMFSITALAEDGPGGTPPDGFGGTPPEGTPPDGFGGGTPPDGTPPDGFGGGTPPDAALSLLSMPQPPK